MAEKKKSVLIVEDEGQMARILEDRLTLEGYDVTVVSDGEQAVEKVLNLRPDIMLLDIVLPKMDGAKVLAKVLEDGWGHTAHIVFLTNLGDIPASIQEAMEKYDTIDYIVKVDTSLEDIIEKVKEKLAA